MEKLYRDPSTIHQVRPNWYIGYRNRKLKRGDRLSALRRTAPVLLPTLIAVMVLAAPMSAALSSAGGGRNPAAAWTPAVIGLVFLVGAAAWLTYRTVRGSRQLAEAAAQFRSLFEASNLSIIIHDYHSGAVIEANRRAVDSYGLQSVEELRSRDIFDQPPYSRTEAQAWQQRVRTSGPQRFEWRSRRSDGSVFWEDVFLQIIPLHGVERVVSIAIDITERKRIEEQMRHMAQHDVLTGLANRALFSDRVQQAISRAGRTHSQLAVLYIDLDHFKPINDTYGHAVGDAVLKTTAERLQSALRTSDSLGRIGGDEFNVLLTDVSGADSALAVAEKIARVVARPIDHNGHCLSISASIGVAIYPDHGSDEISLLSTADRAMYSSKTGRAHVSLAEPRSR